MLKAPQNLFATAYDGSVRSDWQTVEGADGYILQFYNADEPEKLSLIHISEPTRPY